MAKQYIFPEIPDEVQTPMHFVRVKWHEFIGADPALIYALRKTDLWIKPKYRSMFSDDERTAWDNAIAEFQKANPGHIIVWQVMGGYGGW